MNLRYETVRRIIITGTATMKERQEIFNHIGDNGYYITKAGPMILRKNFPYIEKNKYKIIAEKRIK